jgi:hypothetical protein
LDIDFQDDIDSQPTLFGNPITRGAIPVAKDARVFEKPILARHLLKLDNGKKVISNSVDFTRARFSSGRRHTPHNIMGKTVRLYQHPIEDGVFSDRRRAGDNEQQAAAPRR